MPLRLVCLIRPDPSMRPLHHVKDINAVMNACLRWPGRSPSRTPMHCSDALPSQPGVKPTLILEVKPCLCYPPENAASACGNSGYSNAGLMCETRAGVRVRWHKRKSAAAVRPMRRKVGRFQRSRWPRRDPRLGHSPDRAITGALRAFRRRLFARRWRCGAGRSCADSPRQRAASVLPARERGPTGFPGSRSNDFLLGSRLVALERPNGSAEWRRRRQRDATTVCDLVHPWMLQVGRPAPRR